MVENEQRNTNMHDTHMQVHVCATNIAMIRATRAVSRNGLNLTVCE